MSKKVVRFLINVACGAFLWAFIGYIAPAEWSDWEKFVAFFLLVTGTTLGEIAATMNDGPRA